MSPLSPHLRTFLSAGLANLGPMLVSTARVYFVEQYFCRQLHPASADGVIPQCTNDAEVEAALARTIGWYNALALLPGLILTAPYASLALKYGQWNIIRLGVLGQVAAAVYTSLMVFLSPAVGINWILLAPLFDVLGGGLTVNLTLVRATVARDAEPDERVAILFRLMAFEMVCSFLGTFFAAQLLQYCAWLLITLGIFTIGLGILVTFLGDIIDSTDGPAHDIVCGIAGEREALLAAEHLKFSIHTPQGLENCNTSIPQLDPAAGPRFGHALVDSYRVFWDGVSGDAMMSSIVAIIFVSSWARSIQVVFVPWASQRYAWSVADSTSLQAGSLAISSAVLLVLPWAEQKFISCNHFSEKGRRTTDLWMMNASLIAGMVGIWGIGMSTTSTWYILAMGVFSAGLGFVSSLRSFASSVVAQDPASSTPLNVIFLGIAMAEDVGEMLGTACWSQAFSWLSGREHGPSPGVEFSCSGLVFVAALGIAWRLKVLSARRNDQW